MSNNLEKIKSFLELEMLNKIDAFNFDFIKPTVEMPEPNIPINIFKGVFRLEGANHNVLINGTVELKWMPNPHLRFYGHILKDFELLDDIIKSGIILIFENGVFKDIKITFVNPFDESGWFLEGKVLDLGIIGDTLKPVENVKFSVPNLRTLIEPVNHLINDNIIVRERLIFENELFSIKLDKSYKYETLNELLYRQGGFVNLYGGQITKKGTTIFYSEIKEILYSFGVFLSFLNGRRTSPMFLNGIYEDKKIWEEYKVYKVDFYKSVLSWAHPKSSNYDSIWKKFSTLWENASDRDFLNSVVHWYVEANSNSGYVDGSIILAQVALELVFNWLVIEKQSKSGLEKIKAVDKIRLLLKNIQVDPKVPEVLKNLKKYLNEGDKLTDGPDVIVSLRNSLVHGKEKKRNEYRIINDNVKIEALHLCLWYIELTILFVLDFNGVYRNRCYFFSGEPMMVENVPWKITI